MIKNMHYDVKKKLNKVDSQQYRNLLVPEIDWVLNEAQDMFIDNIAQPRLKSYLGFEKNQRSIDDIRAVVVDDNCSIITPTNTKYLPEYIILPLPADYRYLTRAYVYATKGKCKDRKIRVHPKSVDDEFEESIFDKSNFEWENVNAIFTQEGLKLYTDKTFQIEKVCLSYIRNPIRMHNAEAYRVGGYKLPSGELLTGFQDCELPLQAQREIVDLAVMIIAGELQVPDLQTKLSKLTLNNLI